jgi:hypothetical protein
VSGYREVFKPAPAGDYHDPGKIFYTITPEDLGKTVIHTTDGDISVGPFMTVVRKRDFGKRLYRVQISAASGLWAWALAYDAQQSERESQLDL